jgi:RNA polymerase sigma-70 factor (sigma-E family)
VASADDTAGFDSFVAAESRQLLRAAWLLTGAWADAEDLVQTALEQTWQHWDRVDSPAAYTRRVLVRAFLRARRRHWTGEVATADLPEPAGGVDEAGDWDLRASLLAALDALPARQHAVVVLRYFADLSEQQTADALRCTVGTVKAHASRAMTRLRVHPGLQALIEEAPR